MDKYKTIEDFPDASIIMGVIYAVASAVPLFFAIGLFVIWLFGGGASYFAILRFTNKKRFFHVATSFSFACFVLSLPLVSLNSSDVIVLNGYWVGFYALMTGLSYLGLAFHKN